MTEEKEKYETKKQEKAVQVKVIRTIGETQLVEWQDGKLPRRAIVPIMEKHTIEDLEAGVQYGVRWDELTLKADSAKLAELLYKNDVWTVEDAARSTQKILGILAQVYGVDLQKILRGGK